VIFFFFLFFPWVFIGCWGVWCWVDELLTEWFAEQERLPFEEGFRRSDKVITIPDILMLEKKVNAVDERSASEGLGWRY
jgi:hypothetical protein